MFDNWKRFASLVCVSVISGCSQVGADDDDQQYPTQEEYNQQNENGYEYSQDEGGPTTNVTVWVGPGWYNGIWFVDYGDWWAWRSAVWVGPGWYYGLWFGSWGAWWGWHSYHWHDSWHNGRWQHNGNWNHGRGHGGGHGHNNGHGGGAHSHGGGGGHPHGGGGHGGGHFHGGGGHGGGHR